MFLRNQPFFGVYPPLLSCSTHSGLLVPFLLHSFLPPSSILPSSIFHTFPLCPAFPVPSQLTTFLPFFLPHSLLAYALPVLPSFLPLFPQAVLTSPFFPPVNIPYFYPYSFLPIVFLSHFLPIPSFFQPFFTYLLLPSFIYHSFLLQSFLTFPVPHSLNSSLSKDDGRPCFQAYNQCGRSMTTTDLITQIHSEFTRLYENETYL